MILLQLIVNGLLLGGIYALISIGLTLIFGVVRVINFAHGEFLMLSMYITYFSYTFLGMNPDLSLAGWRSLDVLYRDGHRPANHQASPRRPGLHERSGTRRPVDRSFESGPLFTGDYQSIHMAFAEKTFRLGSLSLSYAKLVIFFSSILVSIGLFLLLQYTKSANRFEPLLKTGWRPS